MSSPYLVTTRAQPAACPRCEAPTLVGLAEGITARVDAAPLPDRQAEIAALLAGLHTYTRLSNSELIYRDASRIRDPRLNRRDIHAQHKCTRPEQGELF
jgi:hypothetical protein